MDFQFAGNQKPTETSGDSEKKAVNTPVEEELHSKHEEELDAPYTDRRSVTIAPVKNYSLYRKANDKVLPKRTDYIGSSYNSSMTLSSSKDEIETYFPAIIGLASNNENFITRVKQYLNNIQVPVDELGKKLDTSFVYNHKRDFIRISVAEDKIEAAFNAVDRSNFKALREALKEKIFAIHNLEASKCKLGHPQNINDYILYRHCLLYSDVAKDLAMINVDRNIRFYFKDDKKEAEKARKFRNEVVKAKQNYVTCMSEPELFEAVYIQYCILNAIPITSALAKSDLDKEAALDKFSTDEPLKFNKICGNKDNKLMSTIEKLIAKGELNRMQNSQNIITNDGTFIGANMSEAVAWFKNPENAVFVNAYMNKLNNM